MTAGNSIDHKCYKKSPSMKEQFHRPFKSWYQVISGTSWREKREILFFRI
jgi:hypothetical protein